MKHIPAVDANELPWRGGRDYHLISEHFDIGEADDETYYDSFGFQLLSFDEESGRQTKRERYKAGFAQHNYGYHRCSEEVFTLAGEFRYPDSAELFRPGCYVYRPPGWIHNGEVIRDAQVIVRHDARFSMVTGFPADRIRTNALFADHEQAVGPRGFVVHVDANLLAWRPVEPGCWVKVLSADAITGGRTVLVRLAPGYRSDQPRYCTTGEETFVVSGSLQIGEALLGPDHFLSRPRGVVFGAVSTAAGCELLSFFDERPGYVAASARDVGRALL